MKLILHTGGKTATLEQIAATPTPEATDSWIPLPHSRLISDAREVMERNGLMVEEEAHGLARNGLNYFGVFKLRPTNGCNPDYTPTLGLRNSHAKQFPAGLAAGSQVFVCDNLAFSGEVDLFRRHTVNIFRDLPGLYARLIGKLNDLWNFQATRFDAYKRTELGEKEANDLIIRAFQNGACNVTDIRGILEQWKTPNHIEFAAKTAWRLFNAFTENYKGNLETLPKKSQALHALLDYHCGVNAPVLEAN
jgi:hypothetical protein